MLGGPPRSFLLYAVLALANVVILVSLFWQNPQSYKTLFAGDLWPAQMASGRSVAISARAKSCSILAPPRRRVTRRRPPFRKGVMGVERLAAPAADAAARSPRRLLAIRDRKMALNPFPWLITPPDMFINEGEFVLTS